MREWSRAERARGRRIGFVPTMGFLHEGHLRLVDRAKQRADRVAMSVFVNPSSSDPPRSGAYPRDLGATARSPPSAASMSLRPDTAAMYPTEPLVRVSPGPWRRPRGAAGRATSPAPHGVAKLFHIVEPDVAVFGRKDFQQAMLVRRLAADLDFGLEVDVAPTVRELDGSPFLREHYLQGDERRAALALSRALRAVEQAWRGGEADPGPLARRGLEVLRAPGVAPEYLALVDEQIAPGGPGPMHARRSWVAAKVGKTRLSTTWCSGRAWPVTSPSEPCVSSPWAVVTRAPRARRARGGAPRERGDGMHNPGTRARTWLTARGCTTRCATPLRRTSSPWPLEPNAPRMTVRPTREFSPRCAYHSLGFAQWETWARCTRRLSRARRPFDQELRRRRGRVPRSETRF